MYFPKNDRHDVFLLPTSAVVANGKLFPCPSPAIAEFLGGYIVPYSGPRESSKHDKTLRVSMSRVISYLGASAKVHEGTNIYDLRLIKDISLSCVHETGQTIKEMLLIENDISLAPKGRISNETTGI
jgi:hypothetical protein